MRLQANVDTEQINVVINANSMTVVNSSRVVCFFMLVRTAP